MAAVQEGGVGLARFGRGTHHDPAEIDAEPRIVVVHQDSSMTGIICERL
ncbi:hypothetical protein [Nocardia harenae]|nr:hypothetical protein [Nocardia harenae]